MSRFIDVTPYHWAFNDIEEMYYLKDFEGDPFFSGIPYNGFEPGKEAVDVEVSAGINGQSEFIIDGYVSPSHDNPFMVFADGVEVGYDRVQPNVPGSHQSFIKLRRGVRYGADVRFYSAGVPAMRPNQLGQWDRPGGEVWERPVGVVSDGVNPSDDIPLEAGETYVYDLHRALTAETVKCNGKQLKRVDRVEDIKREDEYTVRYGKLFVHYALNQFLIEVMYLVYKEGRIKTRYAFLKPSSDSIIYTNRFFPDVVITTAEVITILNRLRLRLLMKYTDIDFKDKTQKSLYRSDKSDSRFADVQQILNGETPWWWEHVRDIEEIKLRDGRWLLEGFEPDILQPEGGMTRAEAAALINRFRGWSIEVFA